MGVRCDDEMVCESLFVRTVAKDVENESRHGSVCHRWQREMSHGPFTWSLADALHRRLAGGSSRTAMALRYDLRRGHESVIAIAEADQNAKLRNAPNRCL